MAIFKRSGKKDMPEIGTSSDIVFMFLFFFMVTTQMRSTEVKVKVKLPSVTEVANLRERIWLPTSILAPLMLNIRGSMVQMLVSS